MNGCVDGVGFTEANLSLYRYWNQLKTGSYLSAPVLTMQSLTAINKSHIMQFVGYIYHYNLKTCCPILIVQEFVQSVNDTGTF